MCYAWICDEQLRTCEEQIRTSKNIQTYSRNLNNYHHALILNSHHGNINKQLGKGIIPSCIKYFIIFVFEQKIPNLNLHNIPFIFYLLFNLFMLSKYFLLSHASHEHNTSTIEFLNISLIVGRWSNMVHYNSCTQLRIRDYRTTINSQIQNKLKDLLWCLNT